MSRFSLRGFISLLLSASFLVVATSGLLLWLEPFSQSSGGPRLIVGLSKGIWKSTHIYVALLTLTAVVVHLWLNWPAFRGYLWDQASRRLSQKREITLALLVTASVTVASSLLQHGPPPSGAALSPQQVAERAGRPVQQIVAALEKKGLTVHNPADSILEIAKHNNVAPDVVLAVLRQEAPEAMQPPRRGPH